MDIELTLKQLTDTGNFRRIPSESVTGVVDFSSNDYLGIAERADLRERFFEAFSPVSLPMSSSASRLLGARQRDFDSFETTLADSYGRPALTFNSGYHANVGLIQAIADRRTLVVADRLVHASIIDGIRRSGAPFERFRHNDYDHLAQIVARKAPDFDTILIIAESVYSMDGDSADIDRMIDIRRIYPGKALLYIDEAHAVGVLGPAGLGLVAASKAPSEVDIIVGTLGKALASVGAYAVMSPRMRDFMVNKARSLIFSTALPPVNVAWSEFIFRHMLTMDSERAALAGLSYRLARVLGSEAPGHIRPLIVGDPRKAVDMSQQLLRLGFKALPIRTPTVPPGTERLRFSLSAAITPETVDALGVALDEINCLNKAQTS